MVFKLSINKLYFNFFLLFRHLTSAENRHALPMFTSLLNTVCAYDPVGLGVPYNHLLFSDSLEPLVEVALQILIVTLDHDTSSANTSDTEEVSYYYYNYYLNFIKHISVVAEYISR